MERVCALLRVSTSEQDYTYQYNTLKELCERKGWEIVRVFANKVSGAKKNEERQAIRRTAISFTSIQGGGEDV